MGACTCVPDCNCGSRRKANAPNVSICRKRELLASFLNMAASAEPASVGPLAPTSVVDVQVMYEGALPPPYFHRVTDSSGQGANLAKGTGNSVSLWFAQHSDKDLGVAPVVDLQILKAHESREDFQILKQELLREDADDKKRFLGIKRRSSDDTGLGLGNLTVTYGKEIPGTCCCKQQLVYALHTTAPPRSWRGLERARTHRTVRN